MSGGAQLVGQAGDESALGPVELIEQVVLALQLGLGLFQTVECLGQAPVEQRQLVCVLLSDLSGGMLAGCVDEQAIGTTIVRWADEDVGMDSRGQLNNGPVLGYGEVDADQCRELPSDIRSGHHSIEPETCRIASDHQYPIVGVEPKEAGV